MPAKSKSDRKLLYQHQSGDRLEDAVFLLAQKDLRATANGGMYIHAVVQDASGQMLGRMWNASREIFESMPSTGLVAIRGYIDTYKGKPQLIIEGVRSVDDSEIDPSDYLPASERDPDEMWSELKAELRKITDPHLLALVGKFITDEEFALSFRRAPAARTNHHAYLGGLLEHTLSLLQLADRVLPHYPRVNADLVRAGIFFHDAGKTAELSYQHAFEYTSEGQLLGHLVQATLWVTQRAAELDEPFPADLLQQLQHIIVSHHGRYEFGSPKLPATAEAYLVHYLDNLDARVTMVFNAIDDDDNPESDWTGWVHALESRVYKKSGMPPR